MTNQNNKPNPVERDAIDRMKAETASEVLGYAGSSQTAKTGQAGSKAYEKMAAEGEVTAENLGNATTENKYNSSK